MSDDAKSSAAEPVPSPRPERPYDARAAARHLLRTVRSGALATLTPEGDPYASLVTIATLPDGSPVLPLSTLAAHTQHLLADPRCSLLLDSAGRGDPLTHPRLTLSARAVEARAEERSAWRSRFLRRHPKAELYVDFGDFSFWRLEMRGARLIGGFGRIHMLEAGALVTDLRGADALVSTEERAAAHMDADHSDAVKLYATALCGARAGDWRVAGIDPDGLDLACGDETLRMDYPERITDPAALRAQLVRWVDEARARS